MSRKPRSPEAAQQSADAYIELAQWYEQEAARLKASARAYRLGTLLPHYTTAAGMHPTFRGPARRAIDGLSTYDVRRIVNRIRQQLIEATEPARQHEADCHNRSIDSALYGEACGCGVEI